MSEAIEFQLYKGKIKGKFFPESHQYWVEGKRKTGVTTALGIKDKSTQLLSWSQEETAKYLLNLLGERQSILLNQDAIIQAVYASERAKEKASDLGSRVHDWVESYIKHRLRLPGYKEMPEMPEDPNEVTGVTSFLEWESAHKVKYLWSEKILYSKKYDYIGRGDFGALVDGEICLCDIKTGNGLYNSVRAQTAAYAQADTEESSIKYKGRWAIRIAKETESEYKGRCDLKNKIKTILGKKSRDVEPYQVFEAKYLDNEKEFMKRDFDAFKLHWDLMQWDKETDFYRESK